MDNAQEIIDLLNKDEYRELIHQMYEASLEVLYPKWQNEDEETIISYLKAYCISIYLDLEDTRQRGLFLVTLDMGLGFVGIFMEFIERLNATEAKMFDLMHEDVLDRLAELHIQKDKYIYKEISKSDNEIARIIKQYNNYNLMDDIKMGRSLKSNMSDNPYKTYMITTEEINMIDRVKKNGYLNEFAHMLYDDRGSFGYDCDHEIHSDDEILKKLLVNTKRNNPEFEIVYKDGTIVNYYKGDIRIKPYKFKDIVEYTKLYYTENYEGMKAFYKMISQGKDMDYEIGKKMIISSYMKIKNYLNTLDDIYTKTVIDESKKELIKMKRIVKEYDL